MKGLTEEEEVELTLCCLMVRSADNYGMEISPENYQNYLSRYYELVGKVECDQPPTIAQLNEFSRNNIPQPD